MRVVVTGAAGFLGSHLCRALLARGDDVVAIDNLLTGRMENIVELLDNPRFVFQNADVSEYVNVDGEVDAVMHLASPASPKDFDTIPIEIMKVNSLGTHNLLGLSRAKGARFFMASTSEVYGDPLVHPQPESYWGNVNPNGPRSMYDESKRFSEALTFSYHRKHNMQVRIVRIFNTYGPHMRPDDGRVVSSFIVQALKGEPLTMFGAGLQTRSFTYVDDEISGFLKLLDSDVTGPVNIGSTGEFSVRELAEIVLELTGSPSRIISLPMPVDDPKQRKPDISIARTELGWEPTTPLREGLLPTIEYFRTQLAISGDVSIDLTPANQPVKVP
jgi:nucleoside-diphosphate-sugar epimerase